MPTGSRPSPFLPASARLVSKPLASGSNSTSVAYRLIAAGEQLLPVLAAHAVAFPVQIERVGWEHADRTLNVPGSVA
jgi:hypothetical protein